MLKPALLEEVEEPTTTQPWKTFKGKHTDMLLIRTSVGVQKLKYHMGSWAVMGTAAVVENLWSRAGSVLTEERSSLSPLVFEAIMYCKYNERLWNMSDVIEANKRRKKNVRDAGVEQRRKAQGKIDEIRAWDQAHGVRSDEEYDVSSNGASRRN